MTVHRFVRSMTSVYRLRANPLDREGIYVNPLLPPEFDLVVESLGIQKRRFRTESDHRFDRGIGIGIPKRQCAMYRVLKRRESIVVAQIDVAAVSCQRLDDVLANSVGAVK